MLAGNDITPVRERGQRIPYLSGGMPAGERFGDFLGLAPPVQQGKQVAIEPTAQQRVEAFGNQQRLLVAYGAELQMRRQRRKRDEPAVLGSELRHNPRAGVP